MTPIVLAVHFPAKQLSKLRMAAMRLGAKVRVVEKWEYLNAVLTEENKGWTILELHEELLKEHQALHS